MSFESDIQGQNTQLFPVVEINGIWYSTNNVTVDGNYCKPILINIPSIKESVDVESRKFKISNNLLNLILILKNLFNKTEIILQIIYYQ